MSVYCRLIVIAIAGCSISCSGYRGPKLPPKKSVVPVTSVVRVDGAPQEGIVVTLHPVATDHGLYQFPTAVTNADGRFELTTYAENDGAPEGEYRAIFVWPIPESEQDKETDKLKRLYNAPDAPGKTLPCLSKSATNPQNCSHSI